MTVFIIVRVHGGGGVARLLYGSAGAVMPTRQRDQGRPRRLHEADQPDRKDTGNGACEILYLTDQGRAGTSLRGRRTEDNQTGGQRVA